MTRTQVISRKVSMTAAGAALALCGGMLAMGPAHAETPAANDAGASQDQGTHQAEATQQSGPEVINQAVLVKSVTDPTVYYLKVPSPNGIGEAPAPDATYSVDITVGGQTEHFTVASENGRLDLKDSSLVQSAPFEPFVNVSWVG